MAEPLPPIPFGRQLKFGSRGRDVQGVRRAERRWEKTLDPGLGLPLFGPTDSLRTRRFQKAQGLGVDGVYGPRTHAKLVPFFDDYAFLLYTGRQPHPPVTYLQLPADFVPTHETAGLPGYPAVDVFAKPGTVVLAPADGQVSKLSGHDPGEGGVPGGAYGWSIYLGPYFLTHLGSRTVTVGQQVRRGDRIGTVCDAKVAHMASSLSHVHEGKRIEV